MFQEFSSFLFTSFSAFKYSNFKQPMGRRGFAEAPAQAIQGMNKMKTLSYNRFGYVHFPYLSLFNFFKFSESLFQRMYAWSTSPSPALQSFTLVYKFMEFLLLFFCPLMPFI